MSAPDATAFPEGALRSQAVFRTLMRATSSPGGIEVIADHFGQPAPLMPAAAACLTTLCDFETSLWVSPGLGETVDWLRFETDARLAPHPMEAAFALVEADKIDLSFFFGGTQAYPDRGASLVIQCPDLEGGPALTLAGPGIAATASFSVAGLPDDFATQLRANHALFPLGVDLIFVSGVRLLALPRSTRILEAG
jgi:alpha-D-ribose 1-methylphosphonate 5-triphosphate synthase subunit PhnH